MIIIIKLTYNVGSDWPEQNGLSENREQVHDFLLALKVCLAKFEKFDPKLNIPFK